MDLPIKIAISRLIPLISDEKINRILRKARDRLNICPHCGGETDADGECLHKF